MYGVYWGLGYGVGEVIGGIMVYYYGVLIIFVIFGVLCIVILGGYILINYFCRFRDGKEGCSVDFEYLDISEDEIKR